MSALDDLERTLTRAVDAGAAADPAAANRAAAGARTRRGPSRRGRTRGRRRGWHIFVAALLAGGVTTGAVAATGVLRVEKDRESTSSLPIQHVLGTGRPNSPLRILPMRVADPDGGPPWVLRTFSTDRLAACAQAGQLYRGQFGRVTLDRNGRRVFQLVAPSPGVQSRCTGQTQGQWPVIRAAADTQVNQAPGAPTCRGVGGNRGPCAITSVYRIRFGMLGTQARRATLAAAGGQRIGSQTVRPDQGGAYLFVNAVDAAPYRAAQAASAAIGRKIEARFPRIAIGSLPKAERRAAVRRDRARIAYTLHLLRANRGRTIARPDRMRPREIVDADFVGGERLRVAGAGTQIAPVPGVRAVNDRLPRSARAKVSVSMVSRHHRLRVRFGAPVAFRHFGWFYLVKVDGPRAPNCAASYENAAMDHTTLSPARGATVRLGVYPPITRPGAGWCAGRRYAVTVTLDNGRAHGHDERVVGRATFIPPYDH